MVCYPASLLANANANMARLAESLLQGPAPKHPEQLAMVSKKKTRAV